MTEPTSENTVLGHFTLHYKQIIIDEISLEGLEGITLDLLWRRIGLRISASITEKMKNRFWRSILDMKDICVYQLPEPLPHFELQDRFTIVDHDTGELKDPISYLDGPYNYCLVHNEYGSSKYYNSRNLIPIHTLVNIPYAMIDTGFGNTLVLVASIEKRWQALASHLPITYLSSLMPIQYCLLELIGKSRENGQMTVGTSNILNIIREPKNLFYHRKFLKNLGLIKVVVLTQTIGSRGVKSLLLRLNRFHQPRVLSVPKVGKIHKVIEYLRGCPNYSAKSDILLNMRFFTQAQTKKIRKNNNIFEFTDQNTGLELDGEPPAKKPKGLPKQRKIITIVTNSDESSQSEDEGEQPVQNRFKIGVGLMRQAYEMFLEAGTKGISQLELGQALGIEFYTTRMMCRNLKAKKLIKEFFEDKGRQRIYRYVAVAAGINNMDYSEERKKFLEIIKSNPNSFQLEEENQEASTSEAILPDIIVPSVSELPPDIMKEYESTHITEISATNTEKMQVKTLMESSNKGLTLRQFKFANCIIKIVNAKQCVTGYQTLSNMVGKEINMRPMGTKALKVFLKKLVAAGQIKLFKVRWPGRGNELNYMHLICAPHIRITDSIIRNKYKEVHLRAQAKRRIPKKEVSDEPCKPLSMFVNPRYMKIQKLHEMIMKLTYFEPLTEKLNNKPGFLSVPDLMPEMTVKFAISNMSMTGLTEIAHLKIQDWHFNLKLKEAPPEIAHGIMKCKSLKNSLRMNLKALGMYGLIQLVYQPDVQTVDYFNSTLTAFLFYVNRNASILKTAGKWPRECDTESLEINYYFETAEDVKKYWEDVYDISVDTTIDIKENRSKKSLTAPVRKEDEVHLLDNGTRYGDGKGPCGMDSCFYLEIARLWRTYHVREPKPIPPMKPKKPTVKIPKIAKSIKKTKPKRKAPVKAKPLIIKPKTRKGRKRLTDSVSWSREEDNIIIIGMVALAITSPNSQPGGLRVRNILIKDILSIKDEKKTQSVLHRRALMLQSRPALMYEKESLLNEMRRRRHLIQKYEGLIKKLRVRNSTNMSKFMCEARVPMLELAYLIWQVSKSETYTKRAPCVAIDVKNFHENYNIMANTANRMYNIYKTPELSMLREAVFLTIMLAHRAEIKVDKSRKIHTTFKKHPENSLRTVVEQLRRSGAVSAKEKIFNNQLHRLHLEDLSSSMYKVSAHYLRRWIGRLNSEFGTLLPKVMENELPEIPFKGSAEINCLLCETQATGNLKIETAIDAAVVDAMGNPVSENVTVLDIESKHKLKSGSVTWEKCGSTSWDSDKVSDLYQDIEYEPALKKLLKNAIVKTEVTEEYDLNDVILRHLNDKAESGSSFQELLDITKYSSQDLAQTLQQLETQNIVKRVGLQDNVMILVKHIKNWTFQLDDKYIIITPWLNLDLEIRIDIFLEWASVVVNKAFEHPGCSVALLSDSFELITCRALQDICMFLEENECVKLQIYKCKSPDLYSDADDMPVIYDFNPYEATENICVFPVENSLTRYTYIKKIMLEKYAAEKQM